MTLLLPSALLVLATATGAVLLAPSPLQNESATKVTLQQRLDNGPYKNSAYSIRYATQDTAAHRNHVDLVFDACGCVHVAAEGGSKNRIARVPAKALRDVAAVPKDGWQECILPEKGAAYVLDIDAGEVRMKARLLITDVTAKTVKLEWAPLPPPSEAGTKGQCGGPHEAK